MSGVLAALAQELGTDPESLRDALFAGDESLQPTYLTVNAAGQVTAVFTGHVQAGGLDMIADDSTSVNKPDRKIQWHQIDYNGTVVAEIDAASDTGIGQNVIALRSRMANIAPRANAQLIASDDVNGAPLAFLQVGADAITGKASIIYQVESGAFVSFQGVIIDSDGKSNFVMLGSALDTTLGVIRGGVAGSGAIDHGTGFTSTHVAAGRYKLVWTLGFTASPTVLATGRGNLTGAGGRTDAEIDNQTTFNNSQVGICTTNDAGALTDNPFEFLAIGPIA